MTRSQRPEVSFAVACYNNSRFLESAVRSALDQRGVAIEVLVVDDGSTDGSLELAQRLAFEDSRIRTFTTPRNLGPGGARNVALSAMRGRWFAVLDADDQIAPERSAALISAAEVAGANIVADDLVVFGAGISERRFLRDGTTGPFRFTLERYFADSAMFSAAPDPGLLKPMIRRSLLDRCAERYDENLRIGEDDALIVRLLLAGAHYVVVPEPYYRYRKHGTSISHRLSLENIERLATSEARLREQLERKGRFGPEYRRRYRALANAVAFTRAIDALQRRQPWAALRAVLSRPSSMRLFAMPIKARLVRLRARAAHLARSLLT